MPNSYKEASTVSEKTKVVEETKGQEGDNFLLAEEKPNLQETFTAVEKQEEFKAMAAQNCKDENDVRVAVIGNVDSGKSTIVGVLTKHIMDDGRGSARKLVFNFNHEQQNGRTSSIGQEIMGFDKESQQVLLDRTNISKNLAWASIVGKSEKLLTFLDLCGHAKYLKTTMFGLVGLMPDYAMIVVGANMGLSPMAREHIGIAVILKVPLFIVITKIDIAPEEKY